MKVSLNTIKQYIDFDLPPVDELVKRINEQLGGVEEVTKLSEKYKDALIVKVVECEKHPDADRLSVCKIDIGDSSLKSRIKNLDSNLIQVVCGAPNVHAGMWAVWLPPESTVPSTYGTAEPFVLGARELRGVMSNGMLAAGDELGINSNHDGIIELSKSDLPLSSKIQDLSSGLSFADTVGLDDTIIDIENKMFTHRPDLFGQLGVAREIAGILGHQFTSPEWYQKVQNGTGNKQNGNDLKLDVFNEATDKAPRFMAMVMKDVTVGPSPLWLQCELVRLGGKPINNVVDITNYIMLLTAQPTHAYDYDKLRGHALGVRMAHDGEKIVLLNRKTYELTADDIVIVDGEGPVGLAGIMGGMDSEVSSETKNIVLEVANFDMYAVRKSSMRHGLFTDALTRFNKGQSPLQNPIVMKQLQKLIIGMAGGEQASEVVDARSTSLDQPIEANEMVPTLTIEPKFIRDRLGINITKDAMVTLLGNVEFPLCEDCGWNPDDHVDNDQDLHVNVPFWRMDIEQPEDVVEEIGRLYGFDKLPRELPQRTIAPAPKNQSRELKRRVRETMQRAGANEVLTYSFVHENVIKKAGQDPAHAFRLSNALSPDLQYYRTALLPSLLDKVHMNIKAGHDAFALYEIGKSHFKGEVDASEPNVPNEDTHIALVVTANDKSSQPGSPFYLAKNYLQQILDLADVEVKKMTAFDMSTDIWGAELAAMYEPKRSALMVRDGQIWGVIGEFREAVRRAFKLPAYSAGFEVHLDIVSKQDSQYKPLSRFPSTTQDISLRALSDVAYQQLFETVQVAIAEKAHQIDTTVEPVSIYQAEDDTSTKTTTFHIVFTHYDKTLTDADIKPIMDHIATVSLRELSAERI